MANYTSGGGGSHGGGGASRGASNSKTTLEKYSTPVSLDGFVNYANNALANQSSAPDYSSYARQNSDRAAAKEASLLGATEGREITQPTITAPVTINRETGGSTGGSIGGGTAPVDNSYNDMQSYLDALYAAQEAQRQREYQNALGQLKSARDQGVNTLNQNADDALRQAYVSYMMGRRNVNQALSNNGINGGATESVLADLYNNYGNNRAMIDKERANGLANLDYQYNRGVADAGASYGSDYTDLLANYMNGMMSLKQNYANDLARALSNANAQRAANPEPDAPNVDYQNLVSALGRNLNFDDAFNRASNDGSQAFQNGIQNLLNGASNNGFGGNYTQALRDSLAARLKQIYGQSNYDEGTRLYNVNKAMQDLANAYGLTEEQAKDILRYAGF